MGYVELSVLSLQVSCKSGSILNKKLKKNNNTVTSRDGNSGRKEKASYFTTFNSTLSAF